MRPRYYTSVATSAGEQHLVSESHTRAHEPPAWVRCTCGVVTTSSLAGIGAAFSAHRMAAGMPVGITRPRPSPYLRGKHIFARGSLERRFDMPR